jgi:hypothetical protein
LRIIVFILHFSINSPNSYCIFCYMQELLLLASLKPMLLLHLNPNKWNTSNPYIMHAVCVFVSKCNNLKTGSYTGNSPPSLWNSKPCMCKLNTRYYELTCKQNIHLHHTQPHQFKYSIGYYSKSLVPRIQHRHHSTHFAKPKSVPNRAV